MRSKLKVGSFYILIGYGLSFILIVTLVNSDAVHTYVQGVKQSSVTVSNQEDRIAKEIEFWAHKINEEPINAEIDRVWKAIPGYNGLQVDQEKSYHLSRQLGRVDMETLVIQEIEPDIHLDDLPPHPIYRGNPKKPMVSIMVNVAWGTEYLLQMLDILEEYEIKATFFLDGTWLSQNEEAANKIASTQHEIGNHAYSHPDLRQQSRQKIKEEILKTDELIQQLGVKSYLFAPPAGAYDDRVVQIADEHNMKTIMWTLDTVDWQKPPSARIVERIVPHLENGALILMHPTQPTVEALPSIIEGAQKKELMIGTVSELINPERTLSILSMD